MRRIPQSVALALFAVALAGPTAVRAQTVHATLSSHQEVPALSTPRRRAGHSARVARCSV